MNTAIKISTVSKTTFRLKEIFWLGCNFEYSPVIYFKFKSYAKMFYAKNQDTRLAMNILVTLAKKEERTAKDALFSAIANLSEWLHRSLLP